MDGNFNWIENLTVNERIGRFVVSFAVVVLSMQAPWVGTNLFAVTNILAILLILTAIIGWDPVRSTSADRVKKLASYFPHKTDKHHGPRT